AHSHSARDRIVATAAQSRRAAWLSRGRTLRRNRRCCRHLAERREGSHVSRSSFAPQETLGGWDHAMNDRDLNQEIEPMRKLLKDGVAPVAHTELHRDLWPQMLRRLESAPVHVPWWDWALLAAAVAAICIFPGVLPALLFHL